MTDARREEIARIIDEDAWKTPRQLAKAHGLDAANPPAAKEWLEGKG